MQVQTEAQTIIIRERPIPATLTRPAEDISIRAGIVFVHGSGNGSEHEMAVEARRFAEMGIAFLTVQKAMDGYTRTKRDFSRLAQDTLEATSWLRNRPEMQGKPVGIMGISEGGWVSTIAAGSSSELVDFVILESAAIITPGEQIRYHRAAEAETFPLHRRLADRFFTEISILACNYSGYDSRPHLEAITQPMYALWGTADHTIPIDRAQEMLQRHTSIEPTIQFVSGEPHYLNPDGDWLVDVAEWVLDISRT